MIPYFPPDRLQIDSKYADIILPYEEKTRYDTCKKKSKILIETFFSDESVEIKYEWNLDRFLAYITSWSGYVSYMQKYPDKDILLDFRRE